MAFTHWLLFRWDKGNSIIKLGLFALLVLLIDFTVYPGFAALVDTVITSILGYTVIAVVIILLLLTNLIPFAPTAAGLADRTGMISLTPVQQAVRRGLSLIFSDIPELLEAIYEFFTR